MLTTFIVIFYFFSLIPVSIIHHPAPLDNAVSSQISTILLLKAEQIWHPQCHSMCHTHHPTDHLGSLHWGHFNIALLCVPPYIYVIHKGQGIFFFSSDLYLLHPFTGCNKQERSEQRAQYLKHLFPLCLCCLVQEFHSKGHCTSATQAFFRISDQTGLELNCNNTYK